MTTRTAFKTTEITKIQTRNQKGRQEVTGQEKHKKNALIKIKQEMIIRDDEGTKREKDGRMGKL